MVAAPPARSAKVWALADQACQSATNFLTMVLAARYSARRGYISDDDAERVAAAIDAAGLPSELAALGLNSMDADGRKLAAHMLHDKKMDAGTLPFVLLAAVGQAFLDKEVSLDDVAEFLDEQLRVH